MNSLDRKIDASRKRAEAERQQQIKPMDRPPTEGLTSQQSTKDKDVPMQNPYKPGMP